MIKKELKNYIGTLTISIDEVMKKIDRNAGGVVFLLDGDVVKGCISDGDIRRYLLSGGKLSDEAEKAARRNPVTALTRDEAISKYHSKNLVSIPIVDKAGALIDIYMGEQKQIKQNKALKTPVVINAGGKGTRLDPFTRVLPKPLIPVGEIPIIEHIMREYQLYQCNRFHIIVNYKKEIIKAYFHENENSYDISWYEEKEPLGTGGGLSLLKGAVNETFFFSNCDNILKTNYEKIWDFHKKNQNSITMICAYKNFFIPYGVIELGKNGRIESFQEKPTLSYFTNTGIYLVEPEILNEIKANELIDFPDIVKRAEEKGYKVAAYPVSEAEWMDMGQMDEYKKLQEKF